MNKQNHDTTQVQIIPPAILDFIAPVNQEAQSHELDKIEQIIDQLQTNGEYPQKEQHV